MTGAPLPVGVVGVGSLGQHHARLYASLPEARLVGIFDTRAERAAEIAKQFRTTAYPTLDALLADVEAVSVVVPTSAHHEVGLAALARGRHVKLADAPYTFSRATADGSAPLTWLVTVEREGSDRPVCIAESVSRRSP